jgi:hypothetical protein
MRHFTRVDVPSGKIPRVGIRGAVGRSVTQQNLCGPDHDSGHHFMAIPRSVHVRFRLHVQLCLHRTRRAKLAPQPAQLIGPTAEVSLGRRHR